MKVRGREVKLVSLNESKSICIATILAVVELTNFDDEQMNSEPLSINFPNNFLVLTQLRCTQLKMQFTRFVKFKLQARAYA